MTALALGTSFDSSSVADIGLSPWNASYAKHCWYRDGVACHFPVAVQQLSMTGPGRAIVRKEAAAIELVEAIYDGLTKTCFSTPGST